MKLNKTKNTTRNIFWGIIEKIIYTIGPFIVRTIVIYILGANYLGVDSLFSSILGLLNVAEFGFGTALVFSMYKPIAGDDTEKICALMNLYRRIYRIIGFVVLGIGLMLLPFLTKIVNKDLPDNLNIYLLYFIFLGGSVLSYWLYAYKDSLLSAFQRKDIQSKVKCIVKSLGYVCQILTLFLLKDYYIYVVINPVVTILINIISAKIVDRIFPQFQCKGEVSKEEKNEIRKQAGGLFCEKLGNISRNALDSIVISSLFGLTLVGIYNNYMYIIYSLNGLFAMLFLSVQAGLGNSIVVESKEINYSYMRIINFVYMWVSGVTTVCLCVLYNHFMIIWVGEKLSFSWKEAVAFALYFFSIRCVETIAQYISVIGLWWKCKWFYVLEAIANVVLNIVLGYLLGIIGVILATTISAIFCNFIPCVFILYKYFFNEKNMFDIFKDNMLFFLYTFFSIMVLYLVFSYIPNSNSRVGMTVWFVVKGAICFITTNIFYFVMFRNNNLFISSKNLIKNKYSKRSLIR